MSNDRFREELRLQLAEAETNLRSQASHRSARVLRRTVVMPALAAAIILIVVAATIGFGNDQPASASVQVLVRDGYITVRLTDVESRPDEIERVASEAGLDIDVVTEPVGPSNVGKFVRRTATPMPPDARVETGDGSSFEAFRLPVDWDGSMTISLGRRAAQGEQWAVVSNALEPDEPAACLDLLGRPLVDVVTDLEGRGLNVRTFVIDPGEVELFDGFGKYANWPVASVGASGPRDIVIRATQDGVSPVIGDDPRPTDC